MTKKKAKQAYYKLPVTAPPCEFMRGHGNWGLTEAEYRKARRLAKIVCKRKK
jgi:hypothetical protein